jgi:type IV pilus assembly protein PilY1
MRMALKLLRKAGYSVTIAAAVAFSSTTPAAPLGLPDAPLYLASAVPPNLIMAIDDSGSMDFEVLFPGNDGSAWWRSGNSGTCGTTDNNSFIGCVANSAGSEDIPFAGRLNFNNSGNSSAVWKKFSYLFPNGFNNSDTSARRRLGDATNDHFAIPPLPSLAWSRAPDHNTAYFDPEAVYEPWVNGGGYVFTDATPTATRFDPVFEPTVTTNLTQDIAGVGNVDPAAACTNAALPARGDNWYFRVYSGMVLPPGTCFRSELNDNTGNWQVVRDQGVGCRVGSNNECFTRDNNSGGGTNRTLTLPTNTRVAIRYYPATFYLPASRALPTTYSSYNQPPIAGVAPNGTALNGYQIKPGHFSDAAQYQQAIQNFANWFQYYRKRHQALRAGLGQSFSDVTGLRIDGFTINNAANASVTMRSIDTAANRNSLYTSFYRDWVRSGGTPNRTAVARMISEFRRTDRNAPVTSACQRNFGMLFTDGFTNAPAANDGITGVYGNEDGSSGSPYSDSYSGSLADAVMSAYANPLRTDFDPGKLNLPPGCPSNGGPYTGPLDCNANLHMNFFAVTLGTRGLLFNPDVAEPNIYPPYPPGIAPAWPTTFPARHPSAVDDLWHATINGRGKLLNARSPQDISKKMREVLGEIKGQTSTAAAASVNSGSISSTTRVFQAKFNSDGWTGQLLAYSLNRTNGELQSPVWEASRGIPAPSVRKIYTRKSTGENVEFKWTELQDDATRVEQLDPASDPTRAQAMINYLRGDTSNEGTGPTNFRRRREENRTNVLGDIVSSGPLFVGIPLFRYPDSMEDQPYSAFVDANANRPGMVYVGANDGMLHAFYSDGANEGREAFAFIPSPVFSRLRNLSSQSYTHEYFVDGSPSVGDAFFDGAWHTVLAGGLNKGGQGIYAIDITDPRTVNENSLLWEFTDQNDPDLGFTFSQPTIVKLRDGKWYVVFGNGYNSTLPDGSASTTGNAVLFLVDLETGVGRKIDTGVGYGERPSNTIPYDNGLATPSLVDVNGDRVIDYAYAGDLYGNMWKFDLTSSSPASWNVAFGGTPLFRARDSGGNAQPITVRPEVARGPQGNGVVVLFGTGKYLEPGDRLRTPVAPQSFYGIVDRNDPVGNRTSALLQQSILFEGPISADSTRAYDSRYEVRVTSNNQLEVDANNELVSKGWYIDLVSPDGYEGEKQVSNPAVRNGAVIFTTIIPNSDPCGSGGQGWLMELDLLDGSRLDVTPFDLTGDGLFNNRDDIIVDLPEGDAGNGGTGQDSGGNNVGNGNGGSGTASSSGLKVTDGFPTAPGIIDNGEFGEQGRGRAVQYKYLPSSSGAIRRIVENPRPGAMGRQSWRQIR